MFLIEYLMDNACIPRQWCPNVLGPCSVRPSLRASCWGLSTRTQQRSVDKAHQTSTTGPERITNSILPEKLEFDVHINTRCTMSSPGYIGNGEPELRSRFFMKPISLANSNPTLTTHLIVVFCEISNRQYAVSEPLAATAPRPYCRRSVIANTVTQIWVWCTWVRGKLWVGHLAIKACSLRWGMSKYCILMYKHTSSAK